MSSGAAPPWGGERSRTLVQARCSTLGGICAFEYNLNIIRGDIMKKILSWVLLILVVVTLLIPFFCMPTFAAENDLVLTSPNPLVFNEVLNQNYLSYYENGGSLIDIDCNFYLDKDPYRLVCNAIHVIVDNEDGALEIRYSGRIYYNGVDTSNEDLAYSVYDDNHWLVENYADSPIQFTADDMRTLYFEGDTSLNVTFANNVDYVPLWLESNSNFDYDQPLPDPDPDPDPPAPDPPVYQAIYHNLNFDFNNLGNQTIVTMFPGPHSFNMFFNGSVENTLISNDILREYPTRIKTDAGGLAYVQLYITSPYSSLYINDQIFYGTENMKLLGSIESDSIVVSRRQTLAPDDTLYYYLINIYLTLYQSVEEIFRDGYDQGYIDGGSDSYGLGYNTGYNEGYDFGLDVGYDNGYNVGYGVGLDVGINNGASAAFGENLLGETLSGPLKALNSFVIYENGDFTISLGLVVGSMLCLLVLIAFLKLFAGG